MTRNKILCFAGSARKNSFNRTLLLNFTAMLSQNLDIDFLDLRKHRFPIYNGDREATKGLPEQVKIVKRRFADSQGFVIATPEYNGFFTPLLKNLLDWVSRPTPEDPPAAVFKKKIAVLISTSTGLGGGRRSLTHTRNLLENLGVSVMQHSLAIPRAGRIFNEKGKLIHHSTKQRLLIFTHRANIFLARNPP